MIAELLDYGERRVQQPCIVHQGSVSQIYLPHHPPEIPRCRQSVLHQYDQVFNPRVPQYLSGTCDVGLDSDETTGNASGGWSA